MIFAQAHLDSEMKAEFPVKEIVAQMDTLEVEEEGERRPFVRKGRRQASKFLGIALLSDWLRQVLVGFERHLVAAFRFPKTRRFRPLSPSQ